MSFAIAFSIAMKFGTDIHAPAAPSSGQSSDVSNILVYGQISANYWHCHQPKLYFMILNMVNIIPGGLIPSGTTSTIWHFLFHASKWSKRSFSYPSPCLAPILIQYLAQGHFCRPDVGCHRGLNVHLKGIFRVTDSTHCWTLPCGWKPAPSGLCYIEQHTYSKTSNTAFFVLETYTHGTH